MIADTESQGYSTRQYLSVISDKVLENAFKVTTRVLSWNSMSANREPKGLYQTISCYYNAVSCLISNVIFNF